MNPQRTMTVAGLLAFAAAATFAQSASHPGPTPTLTVVPAATSPAPNAPAPPAPAATTAAPSAAFAGAHPYLIGLSVGDLQAAVKWYGDVLGFKVVKAPTFPATGIGLATLELNGFRLELVALQTSKTRAAALPDGDPMLGLRGPFKFGLMVDDIDKAHAELVAKGVAVKGKPTPDAAAGTRYFFLDDPDGNTIQIFARGPAHP